MELTPSNTINLAREMLLKAQDYEHQFFINRQTINLKKADQLRVSADRWTKISDRLIAMGITDA